MRKLVFEIMDDTKKEKKKAKAPKCWICMDQGLIIYDRKTNGMKYEVGARCRCIEGRKMGEAIGLIPDILVEDIAKINFDNFKKRHPEEIKKAI